MKVAYAFIVFVVLTVALGAALGTDAAQCSKRWEGKSRWELGSGCLVQKHGAWVPERHLRDPEITEP
jgi:hypothetical protein